MVNLKIDQLVEKIINKTKKFAKKMSSLVAVNLSYKVYYLVKKFRRKESEINVIIENLCQEDESLRFFGQKSQDL